MKRIVSLLLVLIPSLNYCPIHKINNIAVVTNIVKLLEESKNPILFWDIDKTILYYAMINGKQKALLVDTRSPTVIRDLQNKKIPMTALTARDAYYHTQTEKQLSRFGISFAKSSPFENRIIKGCEHINGIIYTNGTSKGIVSEFLLEDAVLEVDDQRGYLDEIEADINTFNATMQKELGLEPIQFIGLHYTKCETNPTIKKRLQSKLSKEPVF
jgi:hypothetical protein